MLEGIDISNVNAGVDLAAEKQARGLSFVVHKATEGVTFDDNLYAERRPAAAALGLVWGAYHFARPGNDPTAEANHFLAVATPQTGDIVSLDLETTDGVAWADISVWAQTWFSVVDAAIGRPAVLYSYVNYLKSLPTANLVDRPLWMAEPDSRVNGELAPSYLDRWKDWTFHQYGVDGGLDQDHFNGDLTALQRLCGVEPEPCPKRIPDWNAAAEGPYPYPDAPAGYKAVRDVIQGQTVGVTFLPCP